MIRQPLHVPWRLFIDGASRNNPGHAGVGFYLEKNTVLVEKDGFYVGSKTNNQAEYLAVLIGLFFARKSVPHGETISIISDSQLVVRQLTGHYKIKQPHLKLLYDACKQEMHVCNATICHVLREENSEADAMANEGIDLKKFPPKNFIDFLQQHGIVL